MAVEAERAGAVAAPRRWGRWLWLPALILLAVASYYVGGALWLHRVDDDPAFDAGAELPAGASRAVAVAADLVAREVDENRWVANDPWFQPAWVLDNMPHYQTGIVAAVSRFAVELTDHLSRVRGASQIDPDADAAAGRLKYPGDVWILEWSATPVQPSSESQYRSAVEHLRRFNQRLAAGSAVYERRADNLIATLERITSDTGSSSAALFQKIDSTSGAWYDLSADDLFYNVKGRLYAYLLLLRGLGEDFRAVLVEKKAERNWEELLRSFEAAATLQPWFVVNGALDSEVLPNHLANQGFLLLRARFQLYEVINILTK